MEYVPGGSIASLLARFGPLKEAVIRQYTRAALSGLAYLHAAGIAHRDVKGANLLVDAGGNVKLADFGASKKIEDLVTLGELDGGMRERERGRGNGWGEREWMGGEGMDGGSENKNKSTTHISTLLLTPILPLSPFPQTWAANP